MFIDGFTEEDLEKAVGGSTRQQGVTRESDNKVVVRSSLEFGYSCLETTVNFMVFICHGHYKWMVIVYCSQAEPALDGLVIIYCSDIDMVICGGNSVGYARCWPLELPPVC